ncbi:hypothetical protein A2761_01095 [Candidatus Kaiserbacteria bacterium RIFCSPHIGHO2_01_FULL_51_33]|nr:MAG: hypothetical protein A2761_01095 [Candidatus Kaiserbacteria bacterium RIFCSPHIGHO2_01_FULL_51_33]
MNLRPIIIGVGLYLVVALLYAMRDIRKGPVSEYHNSKVFNGVTFAVIGLLATSLTWPWQRWQQQS